ncbi:MAG: ABC transporter ATP-binding protein [Candidatus Glassbacteria bacterium]|nr:ABC transporter ATP-binding protein [Candidatus Glassbacteria bacterium]
MKPAIQLSRVSVQLRRKAILRRITLSIEPGQFWGVVGPNGAGKTTLMRLLAGFVPPSEGSLEVLGRKIERRPPTALRKRIGYLPQNLSFDEGVPFSAREVILIGRTGRRGLFRRLGREDYLVAEACAEELGVLDLLDRPIGTLSGGERQRVQLARALAQQPEILILDEPTSNLDPRAAVRFLETVDRLQQDHGLTVLIVTHEVAHLPAGCGFTAFIKNGALLGAGEKKQMLRDDLLSELYDCRVSVETRGNRYYIFKE